jgi:hypothetical protein
MSYSLIPYAINLKQLRASVGSKKKALVNAVIKGNPKRFKEVPPSGEIALREALIHLIMGDSQEDDSGHVYGYALEQLCSHLGTQLKFKHWCGVHWEVIEIFQLDTLLKASGSPVELPFIPDFPTIGHIVAEDVARTLKDVQERKAETADNDLRGLLSELAGWLKKAQISRKDLVLFYY